MPVCKWLAGEGPGSNQRFPARATASALLVALLVPGCASLQPAPGAPHQRAAQSGVCHAERVQWAVGQAATEAVMARLWRESHAGLVRPIAPNQPVTMDYRVDRVNVEIDRDNRITRVHCG